MDIGIISVRYARALYKRCTETQCEDKVYASMEHLAASFLRLPALRSAVNNPMLPATKKQQLLLEACGGESVNEVLRRFIALVLDKGREDCMQYIAGAYIAQYRRDKHLINAKLTTAVAVDTDTEQKMRNVVEKRTQATVHFTTEVNPELIGGFVLEYDTYRLDASVANKLRNIMAELKQ